MIGLLGQAARCATVAAAAGAIVIGLTAVPETARALSPGEGVAIGLGALAVGTAIGSAPYYGYPGYYGGYAPGYYYQPAPGYYYPPPRSCWNPYYGRYYPC
jgi:hypothetical protein